MKLTNNKTQIVGEFWGTMSSSVEKIRFCSVENDVPKILQVLVDVVGMNLRERNSATVLQVQTDEKTWLTIDQHLCPTIHQKSGTGDGSKLKIWGVRDFRLV